MTDIVPTRYPLTRPRRTRQADWVRRLTRETVLSKDDLIWALIVHDGSKPRIPVNALPGVDRLNLDQAVEAARTARDLGIPALALFPHIDPALKNEKGTEAGNPNGFVPRVIKAIKDEVPEVGVMCDVALDPFTSHGHDGVLNARDEIDNDATISRLVEQSLVQAEAGVDVVAPSDMMDGRIAAIREALEDDDFKNTMIMAYSAKYASAFYGPYREAIGSATALKGDKKTYQMDFGNTDEALRETAMDIAEGADMVMVKPGLPYLDIVQRVSSTFDVPTYVFQISGEYAQIMAASERGWLDADRAIIETLSAFKRAGSDGVITYFAERAARLLS
ncbi:MAG: porphobilinogen synthase [Ponticaulis sp.]|nr:porphobilinogen synthase [Ponticaulis sp.]|tara:strand:- start:27623 stop:28624 length:1002 start_codon:yes stop_codon:yes gene_type:complete